jgi:hypothetical protein
MHSSINKRRRFMLIFSNKCCVYISIIIQKINNTYWFIKNEWNLVFKHINVCHIFYHSTMYLSLEISKQALGFFQNGLYIAGACGAFYAGKKMYQEIEDLYQSITEINERLNGNVNMIHNQYKRLFSFGSKLKKDIDILREDMHFLKYEFGGVDDKQKIDFETDINLLKIKTARLDDEMAQLEKKFRDEASSYKPN